MVSVIYDNALFLTNEEYKLRFPNRKPIDVASTVEHPKLYILGQSKSTDKDQLSYIEEKLKDLNELSNPIKKKPKGYPYMMSCDFSVVMDQPGSLKLVSNVEATSAAFVV